MKHFVVWSAAYVACAALFVAGCGSSAQPDSCTSGPTYTNDVAPIAMAKCIGCHSSVLQGSARRGAPDGYDFDSFELTMPKLAEFADAITSGREPPAEANLETSETERSTVRTWRSCDFPR